MSVSDTFNLPADMRPYIYTQTHTDTHRHTQTQQTHADTRRHTQTHKDTHRHTQTQTDTHRDTQTHTDTHRHTVTHTCTHTDTHTLTHTQAITGTHRHAQAHTSDIFELSKLAPFNASVTIAGDWNIDVLWKSEVNNIDQSSKHIEQHEDRYIDCLSMIESFRARKFSSLTDHHPLYSRPGPFRDKCIFAPITHVPVGERIHTDVPSLLDWAWTTCINATSSLTWSLFDSDHAAVLYDLNCPWSVTLAEKSSWLYRDLDECVTWIAQECPSIFTDLDSFVSFCQQGMKLHGEDDIQKTKHREKMPFQLRSLYKELSTCTNESRRQELTLLASKLNKKCRPKLISNESRSHIKKGKVLEKRTKLHTIKSLSINLDNNTEFSEFDEDKMLPHIFNHCNGKWMCSKEQADVLFESIMNLSNVSFQASWIQVFGAINKIIHRSKVDSSGVAGSFICMMFAAVPNTFMAFLNSFLSNISQVKELIIKASVFAKKSMHSHVRDIRAILPMPWLLFLLDVIVSQEVAQ